MIEEGYMKKLIYTIMALTVMNGSLAQEYKCVFISDNESDGVSISMSQKNANVTVIYEDKKHQYKSCKVEKDDVGVLIDCSAGSLDFMILLNNQVSPAAGGIMSSSLNLFSDINC